MATDTLTRPPTTRRQQETINDFSIAVATANGTGSQTANLTLLRALFKLGIPVHGKNIFPSNIEGLPTWYHIRANHKGYVARKPPNILIAYNRATINQDTADLKPGSVCIHNADLPLANHRDDLTHYPVPVKDLTADTGAKGKIRDYLANMTYVGVLAHLLEIPLPQIHEALNHQFGSRETLVTTNYEVVQKAHAWAAANLQKTDPYRVAPMNATQGLILITGNEAGALGAVYGGVSVAGWYPITPSTSFIDALRDYLAKLRHDQTGKPTYSVLQAEDELAAIGMVVGAGWAGARALTATSGPGLSLMAEFLSLAYYAEVPAVIWDVQRVGPSTGLPTRTSQGDIGFAYTIGHGDTKHVLLLPATASECFEFGYKAHDLADTLQTPVIVMSDLDLGMNNWMSEPFTYPEQPMQRGKLLSAEQIDQLPNWGRYRDTDGDGITYRTIPGNENPRAAWFGRGTGHDEYARYSEDSSDWVNNMERLARKFETARNHVPPPHIEDQPDAELAIIAYGTTHHAIREARDELLERGVKTAYMRIRALPTNHQVEAFIAKHENLVLIEMNRDAQLTAILRNEYPHYAARIKPIAYMDGMPYTPDWVVSRLTPHLPTRNGNGTNPAAEGNH